MLWHVRPSVAGQCPFSPSYTAASAVEKQYQNYNDHNENANDYNFNESGSNIYVNICVNV